MTLTDAERLAVLALAEKWEQAAREIEPAVPEDEPWDNHDEQEDAAVADTLRDCATAVRNLIPELTRTCRHCGRGIEQSDGAWIDPEAAGDDSVWREVCDAHDTFTAEHEPAELGSR